MYFACSAASGMSFPRLSVAMHPFLYLPRLKRIAAWYSQVCPTPFCSHVEPPDAWTGRPQQIVWSIWEGLGNSPRSFPHQTTWDSWIFTWPLLWELHVLTGVQMDLCMNYALQLAAFLDQLCIPFAGAFSSQGGGRLVLGAVVKQRIHDDAKS